jgi:hypothetical protein
MGSFRKLLWDQPIRGVLHRPSEPAALIRHNFIFRPKSAALEVLKSKSALVPRFLLAANRT